MKLIKVDMSTKTARAEAVPEAYLGLGGRGLTAIMINTEVPPTCDPLGPENKLILAPGTLSGTPLVNTSRISIGAKSPLTGGIKESGYRPSGVHGRRYRRPGFGRRSQLSQDRQQR